MLAFFDDFLLFINLYDFQTFTFNYYGFQKLNYFINNIYNPIIKTIIINNKNFELILIDSSNSSINLNEKNIIYKKLPSLNNNYENEKIFYSIDNIFYVKLDNYIVNINDISNIPDNNYKLSVLNKSKLNLYNFDISGVINYGINQIIIQFNSINNLLRNSFYLINSSFIYLSDICHHLSTSLLVI